jgi:hypothetical protein
MPGQSTNWFWCLTSLVRQRAGNRAPEAENPPLRASAWVAAMERLAASSKTNAKTTTARLPNPSTAISADYDANGWNIADSSKLGSKGSSEPKLWKACVPQSNSRIPRELPKYALSAHFGGVVCRRSCRRCTPATLPALKGFPTAATALS